jgi:hypothetical protein
LHVHASEHNSGTGNVVLVVDAELGSPAQHGLNKLAGALQAQNVSLRRSQEVRTDQADFVILAGKVGTGSAAETYLKVKNVALPDGPEALVIHRTDIHSKPGLILCGSDDVGLMYAALDCTDRVSWSKDSKQPFKHIQNVCEKPTIEERAVSAYTMQRVHFEQFLFDETHLEHYFDMLAASRINSFVLIFGYENGGFMAPAYPYFFDVEGFPDVELVGTSPAQQVRNTRAFKRMIDIAHSRGVRFCPAFWDHIYRGKVQGGGIPGASEKAGQRTPHLVSGVTTENLIAYNKAALVKFMEVFPDIDAIQFRIHWESGLSRKETPGFWHDMFDIIRKKYPKIQIDLRAKGLPDEVIEDAIAQGLNFRITTKYWMEQMGLPFHPTHINTQNQRDRRHGYADLLSLPQRYPMHWRLWNGGTTRMLLWADPDYVRRFAESTRVYNGTSFEINEMLATKMLGEEHDTVPFELLNPTYRYYDFECERYWHYYQVWGRMSYNPETQPDIWEQEFSRRFGRESGTALMQGLHLASRVLPRIVAASYRYQRFPTTRGWAEMQRMGDLPVYAKAEGTDIQQFMNTADYARLLIDGGTTAMRTPIQTSFWFASVSETILKKVGQAERNINATSKNEFLATVTDLTILAHLAAYHAQRLLAGVHYNLYDKTGDLYAFDKAIEQEKKARDAWSRIVAAAGDIYCKDLAFGVHRVGFSRHWSEELAALDQGIEQLIEERKKAKQRPQDTGRTVRIPTPAEIEAPEVILERIKQATPGQDLIVHVQVSDPDGIQWVRLRYRHLTQLEDYLCVDMKRNPNMGLYTAVIPGDFIVPQWHLMYFIEAVDALGNGCMIPDLEMEMPYVIVETTRD